MSVLEKLQSAREAYIDTLDSYTEALEDRYLELRDAGNDHEYAANKAKVDTRSLKYDVIEKELAAHKLREAANYEAVVEGAKEGILGALASPAKHPEVARLFNDS